MSNNLLIVNAKYVSPKKIYYECPFCWTSKNTKKQYRTNNNTGKIIKILIGQYRYGDIVSGSMPKKEVMGCAAQAAKDPFIAKTTMIKTI